MLGFGSSAPSPFDVRWRMFGIPVRIKPSFWLFCLFFGLHFLLEKRYALFGIWVGCTLFSFFFKELGHVLVGRMFGVPGGIVLYAFGGSPVGEYEKLKRWQRILFYAAGPAVSFVLWGAAWAYLTYGNPAQLGNWELFTRRVLVRLKDLNLFWGMIHLLPIYPLDGGMILRELCEAVSPRRGLVFSLIVSLACAGALAGWAGYVLWYKTEWPFGDPLFSLIFDTMLAIDSLLLLIKALRERPPSVARESDDEYHEPAVQEKKDYDDYRPFDGGRFDDTQRR